MIEHRLSTCKHFRCSHYNNEINQFRLQTKIILKLLKFHLKKFELNLEKSKTFILVMSKSNVFASNQNGFAVCNNLRFAFGNKTLNPHMQGSFFCLFMPKKIKGLKSVNIQAKNIKIFVARYFFIKSVQFHYYEWYQGVVENRKVSDAKIKQKPHIHPWLARIVSGFNNNSAILICII